MRVIAVPRCPRYSGCRNSSLLKEHFLHDQFSLPGKLKSDIFTESNLIPVRKRENSEAGLDSSLRVQPPYYSFLS